MSQYPNAKFITSANKAAQFLPDSGSEVAFAGRSNSGKSSAINVIVNRRQFARTSKTPGRTQLINFFELRDQARLADLPGYGYAKVSDAMRDHWGRLLTSYITQRSSLNGLFLITDVRRGIADFDRQLLELAETANLRVHVLLTKADKLKRGKAATALLAASKELGDRASAQLFSSLNRQGIDQAREALEQLLTAPRRTTEKKNPGVS
jgi:GTP-binding protein